MAGIRLFASAAFCCALVASCAPASTDNESATDNSVLNGSQLQLPPSPVIPSSLDRKAMLLAVAEAASAHALGQDDASAQRSLDGQQFEFRIRFGCQPTTTSDSSSYSVAFDEKARTLRISASPSITATDEAIAAITHDQVEAVEGFWVDRPWLLAAGCPKLAIPPAENESQPAEETKKPEPKTEMRHRSSRIGIAQFFGEDENRTLRRDSRAYQVTKTLADNVLPSASGYDLVFAGRLRKMPDGRVVACSSVEGEGGPTCVISVSFDRVSIRRGDNDELLAEWGSG